MDMELALEVADEAREGGYGSQTHQALYLLSDSVRGAVAGLKGVDDLLKEAGFSVDSSARHQLSIVRSMLMANAEVSRSAPLLAQVGSTAGLCNGG